MKQGQQPIHLIGRERDGVKRLDHEGTVVDLHAPWDTALGIESMDPIDKNVENFDLSEGDIVRAVIRDYQITGEIQWVTNDNSFYVSVDDEVGLSVSNFYYSGATFQAHGNPVRQQNHWSAVYEFEIIESE